MSQEGITVTDLSHDSLAKRHLRHMVGGHAGTDVREVVYQFEFPERPGALSDFLTALDSRWNISLLQKTGFPMTSESGNVAYQYFLKG